MGIPTTPVQGDFVARVTGLDLSKWLDDGDFGQVRDSFHHYAVLVFPEQLSTDGQQIAFSERFGPLEVSIRKDRPRRIANPRISDISNVDERDRVFDPNDERAIDNAGNRLWHSDSSFKGVPAMASLLGGEKSRPRAARPSTPISVAPATRCPPSASTGSTRSSPSTASSTRAG
jgi:alpha-ketoglutarate-dependent 2,4-dichlorophenoxyacetate dioxygenase